MSSLLIAALDSQHNSQHDATTHSPTPTRRTHRLPHDALTDSHTTHSHERNLKATAATRPQHTKLPEQQPTPATAESPGVLVVARMAKGGIEYAVVSTALLCTLLNQPSLDLHEA